VPVELVVAVDEVAAVEQDNRLVCCAQAIDEGGPPGQPTLLAVSPAGDQFGLEAALRHQADLDVRGSQAGVGLRAGPADWEEKTCCENTQRE
jgi:hypothetical protein